MVSVITSIEIFKLIFILLQFAFFSHCISPSQSELRHKNIGHLSNEKMIGLRITNYNCYVYIIF